MSTETKTIWFLPGTQTYYHIPASADLGRGSTAIASLKDEQRTVDAERLAAYTITKEQALAALRDEYALQLEHTKEALIALNLFAAHSGQNDEEFIRQQTTGEFNFQGGDQPFAAGKEIVEDLLGSMRNPGATTKEQEDAFMRTFGKVPQLMHYFDKENLALAAKNPEKWAKEMHDKLFGEQEAAKKKARSAKLKQEVRESIARGLRQAGMEPNDPSDGKTEP